nr:NUDIX hydrolase 2-like isoform X2 [Tanacetum cinerariifolium]
HRDHHVSTPPPPPSHQQGCGWICCKPIRVRLAAFNSLKGVFGCAVSTNGEVKEEAGINTEFLEVLAFRQSHKSFFSKSDLMFVCMLKPKSSVIEKQDSEIEAAQWMPVEEYANQPFIKKHKSFDYIAKICMAKKDNKYVGFSALSTATATSAKTSYLYSSYPEDISSFVLPHFARWQNAAVIWHAGVSNSISKKPQDGYGDGVTSVTPPAACQYSCTPQPPPPPRGGSSIYAAPPPPCPPVTPITCCQNAPPTPYGYPNTYGNYTEISYGFLSTPSFVMMLVPVVAVSVFGV